MPKPDEPELKTEDGKVMHRFSPPAPQVGEGEFMEILLKFCQDFSHKRLKQQRRA